MNIYDTINELATAATTEKKPSKTDAIGLFEDLIFSGDEKTKRAAAAKLYKFFMPQIATKTD